MICCETVAGADCHCPGCHVTFRGLTLFDAHQRVDYDRDPVIICIPPQDLRVTATGKRARRGGRGYGWRRAPGAGGAPPGG